MLRRLAALERQKIIDEHAELAAIVAELEAILADPGRLDAMLAAELKALKAKHATPRRTRLPGGGTPEQAAPATARTAGAAGRGADVQAAADLDAAPVLGGQPVTVYVTRGGYLKAVAQRRVTMPHSHPGDPLAAVVRADADQTLLCIDADGTGYRVAVADLPVTTMRQRGTQLALLVGAPPDAPLAGAVVLRARPDGADRLRGRPREAHRGRGVPRDAPAAWSLPACARTTASSPCCRVARTTT